MVVVPLLSFLLGLAVPAEQLSTVLMSATPSGAPAPRAFPRAEGRALPELLAVPSGRSALSPDDLASWFQTNGA
eukprot:11051671-Heterocapsa_arctica.AAC.1